MLVITVVFNAERTIEKTIKLVFLQSYENIEYIIIDGGSNDNTLNIVEKYKKQIDYYISEPDSDIYNAMNKGISLAHGDYICILNADDHYDEFFVDKSVTCALQTGVDSVYSDVNMGGNPKKSIKINDAIFFTLLEYKSLYIFGREKYL